VIQEQTYNAKEIRQETIRILKDPRRPKSALNGAERRALRSLKANGILTVRPGDKANAAVMLGISDYKQKISTLLEGNAYVTLKKDSTDSIERKTVLLKKSQLAEEVCQQLGPQGSTPSTLYGLPKILKYSVSLRPIVNTIDSLNYRLAQHLAGLLSCYSGHSPHHVKN
jgi:hypothetical protein